MRADHVVVCGGAVHTPALLQRSGLRRGIGGGLKMHPTIKMVARFPQAVDHDDVPLHRITEFSPDIAIGGSASRRGHIALALADGGADAGARPTGSRCSCTTRPSAATPAAGSSRCPGAATPLVSYRLTDGDLSRLARGLVHLGQALLAAGATELHPVRAGRHGRPHAGRPRPLVGRDRPRRRPTS